MECLEVMYDDETLREFDKQIARRQPSQLSKGIFVQAQSSAVPSPPSTTLGSGEELDEEVSQMLDLPPETE